MKTDELQELEAAEREFDQQPAATHPTTVSSADVDELYDKWEDTRSSVQDLGRKRGQETIEKVNQELKRDFPSREEKCPRCQTEYLVLRKPDGQEVPSACPSCYPVDAVIPRTTARTPDPQPSPTQLKTEEVLEHLENAGVNVNKYQDAQLERFIKTHDGHALELAGQWIEEWQAQRRRKQRWLSLDWLYFYGTGSTTSTIGAMGNGKTFLAIAIARHLIESQLLNPRKFVFATAESILLESEATFRSNSDMSEKNLLKRYEQLDLLIIDDLGVRSNPSPHGIRLFDELTKRRLAKPTIWTSNFSIPSIMAQGEGMKRIADRIAGEAGEGSKYAIEFKGPSQRYLRAKRGRV